MSHTQNTQLAATCQRGTGHTHKHTIREKHVTHTNTQLAATCQRETGLKHTHRQSTTPPTHKHTTRTPQTPKRTPPHEHPPQTLNNARRWRDDGQREIGDAHKRTTRTTPQTTSRRTTPPHLATIEDGAATCSQTRNGNVAEPGGEPTTSWVKGWGPNH